LDLFESLLTHSPLIGVFGHRQVGKTSMVSHEVENYVTFDDEDRLLEAERSPKEFISSHSKQRMVIDECQMCPRLFPALKEWVRNHPKPGQFVLTGSVRFSSRKAIRESLTGRLLAMELYPLVLTELLDRRLPDTLPRLLSRRSFDQGLTQQLVQPSRTEQNAWIQYLDHGGLPKIAFTRNARSRTDMLSSILNLILDRDLRLIIDTQLSLETLRRFLSALAKTPWQPINYSEMRRQLGLSEATQKKLLFAFESIYLLRRIPIEGRKADTFLLEDQLEEWMLSSGQLPMPVRIYGSLYRNLRAQVGYRSGTPFEVFSYQLRSGAHVPLGFRAEGGELGFIVLEGEEPTIGQRRSADRFLLDFPDGKIIYIMERAIHPKVLGPRTLLCSAASLII
jgi:hypothetical protein